MQDPYTLRAIGDTLSGYVRSCGWNAGNCNRPTANCPQGECDTRVAVESPTGHVTLYQFCPFAGTYFYQSSTGGSCLSCYDPNNPAGPNCDPIGTDSCTMTPAATCYCKTDLKTKLTYKG